VAEAIRLTRGKILVDDNAICDARFSKCCGGITEEFQYCWENEKKSYLSAVRDVDEKGHSDFPDLTIEAEADKWIRSQPAAFCNTRDPKILSQVLNDYDQETKDFYRWTVEYTQQQISELISSKSGMDFGEIKDLQPVERGKSGRLSKMKIIGTKRTLTIGKELEIRRILSKSHLYSSAFVVDRLDINEEGVPARFRILGAGWGHGVGLCQIGAAVMGEKGYTYDYILLHYYRGAEILKIYS
jgi:SpoIID/LytB domain protein